MVSVLEEYRVALAVQDAAVHRYLGEMTRCESGTGRSEDVVTFLQMVRAAHEQVQAKRQQLMTEVAR
jgi:hypothetical protein